MKVGRPKAQNPRNKHISLVVTEAEFQKISRVATKKNMTKTDAIVRGIDLLELDKPKKFKNITGTNQKNSSGNVDDDDD